MCTVITKELASDSISMIIENGRKEQNKYRKEMEQLCRDLESKKTELEALESTLQTTKQTLFEIECRHSTTRRSLAKSGADSQLEESRKTCLKADEVDFELQIDTVEFLRDELRSRLTVKEEQLEKSKQAIKQVQTALEPPVKRSNSEPEVTLKRHRLATKSHAHCRRSESVREQIKVKSLRQYGGSGQSQKSIRDGKKTSQP